jgi:hypothetical protein
MHGNNYDEKMKIYRKKTDHGKKNVITKMSKNGELSHMKGHEGVLGP